MMTKKKQNKKAKSVPPSEKARVRELPKDKTPLRLTVLLILICVALYSNTLNNEYALDDTMFITENTSTQKGFAGIKEHLSQDLLFGHTHVKSKTAASSGWRPLSLITFSAEVGFFGKNHPGISHGINLILYTIVVVLLFNFLYKYFLRNIWLSFFAVVLFAIHPIHTEVVANVKSRDEILCLLFLLFSMLLLWKFVSGRNVLFYILSLLCFFISLTSKETSFAFLLGIPVMLYFLSPLNGKQAVGYSSGFIIIAIIYLIIRNAIVPFVDLSSNIDIINNSYMNANTVQAMATKLYVLLLYLQKLLYPVDLSYDYSYNHITYRDFTSIVVWISLIIYISIFIYAVVGFRKKNLMSLSIIMFFITMALPSNIFIEIGMIMGDRLLFIPSIFFCVAIVILVSRLVKIISEKIKLRPALIISVLFVPVFLAFSYLTIARNAEWKDERILTLVDIKKVPNSSRANNGAGGAYLFYSFEIGNTKAEKDSLALKALYHLKKSIEIYPEFNDAVLNIGVAYSQLDSLEKAEEYWAIVRNKNPRHPKLLLIDKILANKYLNSGLEYARKNNVDSAIIDLNKALKYSAYNDSMKISSMYNLGGMYFTKGDYQNSYEMLGKVMQINPEYMNVRIGYQEAERMLRTDNK